MPLHEGQRKFLHNSVAKVNVLVPANRWGKSVTIAIKQIHACFYKKGIGRGNEAAWNRADYRTANIAPQSAMTEPVFKTVKSILTSRFMIPQPDGSVKNNDCLIGWMYDEARTLNTPPYKIKFIHNAEIEFRSLGEDQGDSLQGKPYGYISYDEAGRSHHLHEEVREHIIPRLADWNGTLDIVSTPDQSSPSIIYHHDLFQMGELVGPPQYYSQEGSAVENHFLPLNYVPEMEEFYGNDPIKDQVLHGKFVFAGANLFSKDDIDRARDASLNDGVRYISGHTYILATDTAMGEDEMVHQVLDVTGEGTKESPYYLSRQVAFKGSSKGPAMQVNDFIDLFDSYDKDSSVRHILETWNGESGRFYLDLPRYYQSKTYCYGSWSPFPSQYRDKAGKNPRNVKKADLLIALRKLLESGGLRIPDEQELIKQLSIYREDDKKLPTDRVMSLALACWKATDGKVKNPKVTFEAVVW